MQKETYIDLKGFEGYYEVSNMGNVRRKKTPTYYKDGRVGNFSQTVLKKSLSKKGYEVVYLSVGSKKYTKVVHRLVAISFIPNPENKAQVNHIDLDKKNNCVENLEWMTNSENMKHAIENGVFIESIIARTKDTYKRQKYIKQLNKKKIIEIN